MIIVIILFIILNDIFNLVKSSLRWFLSLLWKVINKVLLFYYVLKLSLWNFAA